MYRIRQCAAVFLLEVLSTKTGMWSIVSEAHSWEEANELAAQFSATWID
jgi:hypothetical protein